MSKEFKNLIDSVDSENQAHSDLKIMIKRLKEEVQRLNFTVSEQKKNYPKSKIDRCQYDSHGRQNKGCTQRSGIDKVSGCNTAGGKNRDLQRTRCYFI